MRQGKSWFESQDEDYRREMMILYADAVRRANRATDEEIARATDSIIKRFPKTMNYLADAEAREAVEGNHSRKMVERPKK